MLVKDYLEQEGLDADELAVRLQIKPSSVHRRLRAKDDRAEMPELWTNKLNGTHHGRESSNGVLEDDGRVTRDRERPPTRPGGAEVRREQPPADMSTVAGYIEGAYQLAGRTIEATDPALGLAISSHAEPAGQAWAKWIESEPKVKALIERMMIGTPLGEVIGVHVGIAFAYFMSRGAMQKAIEDAAAEAVAAAQADEPAVV